MIPEDPIESRGAMEKSTEAVNMRPLIRGPAWLAAILLGTACTMPAIRHLYRVVPVGRAEIVLEVSPLVGKGPLTVAFLLQPRCSESDASYSAVIEYGDGNETRLRLSCGRSTTVDYTYHDKGTYEAVIRLNDPDGNARRVVVIPLDVITDDPDPTRSPRRRAFHLPPPS